MLKMATQTSCQKKSSTVSFSVIISLLSVLFYCAGFVRVELLLNEQQKKIIKLEDVVEGLKTTASDGEANLSKNTVNGKFVSFGNFVQYLKGALFILVWNLKLQDIPRILVCFSRQCLEKNINILWCKLWRCRLGLSREEFEKKWIIFSVFLVFLEV